MPAPHSQHSSSRPWRSGCCSRFTDEETEAQRFQSLMASHAEEWVGLGFTSSFFDHKPCPFRCPQSLPATFPPALILRTFSVLGNPHPCCRRADHSCESTSLRAGFVLLSLRASGQAHSWPSPGVPCSLFLVTWSLVCSPRCACCSPGVFLQLPTFPQHPCCSFRHSAANHACLQHLVAK